MGIPSETKHGKLKPSCAHHLQNVAMPGLLVAAWPRKDLAARGSPDYRNRTGDIYLFGLGAP